MSAKKKPVSTPLHLLQQLTGSLLEHFEQACAQALTDAEKMLAKLEKQRVKAQDKLHKHRARVDEAASAGKAKAQAKARANVEALEGALDELQRRQSETRQYIGQLKDDIQASLALVQGVGKVREAVGKALDQRGKASVTPGVKTPRKAAAPKPGTAEPATAKPAASRKSATASVSAVATVMAPLAKPAATPRKPPLRKATLAKAVAQAEENAAQPAPKRAPRKPRVAAVAKNTGASTPSTAAASDAPESAS